MVKLQKHKAYVYKTESGEMIEHYKHQVNLPEDTIERLGWKQGVELKPVVEGTKLILEPANRTQKIDKPVKENNVNHINARRSKR